MRKSFWLLAAAITTACLAFVADLPTAITAAVLALPASVLIVPSWRGYLLDGFMRLARPVLTLRARPKTEPKQMAMERSRGRQDTPTVTSRWRMCPSV